MLKSNKTSSVWKSWPCPLGLYWATLCWVWWSPRLGPRSSLSRQEDGRWRISLLPLPSLHTGSLSSRTSPIWRGGIPTDISPRGWQTCPWKTAKTGPCLASYKPHSQCCVLKVFWSKISFLNCNKTIIFEHLASELNKLHIKCKQFTQFPDWFPFSYKLEIMTFLWCSNLETIDVFLVLSYENHWRFSGAPT